MKWLAEFSEVALRAALRAVAPELGEYPITLPPRTHMGEPMWWGSSAAVGEEFIAKFAWSRPAARLLANEIGMLAALAREPAVPFLPEVIASSADPVLLVTRRVAGRSLFEVVDSIDRDLAGQQLARFLATLNHPAARRNAEASAGGLTGARVPPASTQRLRERFGRWARPGQRPAVLRWCDWVDAVLASPGSASPGPAVLVHGDLHGDNQVWERGQLRLVVDWATAGLAEPEYDLRVVPGTGPGVELLTAIMRHYERLTGRRLSAERVMAWHLRTALGDALWRSEAGIDLPDRRTPPEWVDDLTARFAALGLDPGAPAA